MDAVEKLDVYDINGTKIDCKYRSEVHKNGLWHKSVHVWVTNDKNKVLIQKRSPQKENHPNMWDISAAGHVVSGKNPLETAISEIKEELGVEVKEYELEKIGVLKAQSVSNSGAYINNEINYIYIYKTSYQINNFVKQENEVSDLKYINPLELKQKILNEDSEFVMHDEEYPLLFEYLEIKK